MEIVFLILLILINALFVAIEMSFIVLNDYKIEAKAKKGDKKSLKISKMLSSPSKFLATIQIGITFVGFLSSAFASNSFASDITPYLADSFTLFTYETWNVIVVVIITILLSGFMLVFGELVPKRIAMKHSEKIAYKTINLLKVIYTIFKPFVYILTIITNFISKIFGIKENDEEIVTEEEVKMLVDECQELGNLQKYERDYIHNILKFNDIKISKVMTPFKKVVSLSSDLKCKDVVDFLMEFSFNKYPVIENNEIIGVIASKDLLKYMSSDLKLVDIKTKPLYIEDMYIYEAFNIMKINKTRIAVVTSSNKNIGIITMTDILEEIVGNF